MVEDWYLPDGENMGFGSGCDYVHVRTVRWRDSMLRHTIAEPRFSSDLSLPESTLLVTFENSGLEWVSPMLLWLGVFYVPLRRVRSPQLWPRESREWRHSITPLPDDTSVCYSTFSHITGAIDGSHFNTNAKNWSTLFTMRKNCIIPKKALAIFRFSLSK